MYSFFAYFYKHNIKIIPNTEYIFNSKLRLPIITCISHWTNFLTTSKPMPRAPPVITATFPGLLIISYIKKYI